MALPSNISLVTVTGSYSDFAGNPIAGSIRFTSSATLRDMLADVIVVASTSSVVLDVNGSFSIVLPATNDPNLSDVFTYGVEESFNGGRSYTVTLAGVDGADRINLVTNPSFETNTTGWFVGSATLARVTTPLPLVGTAAMSITSTSAGTVYAATSRTITGSTQYTWSGYIKSVTSRSVLVSIDWYAAGSVYISSTGGTASASSTDWKRYSLTATAPANAVTAAFLIIIGGTLVSEVHYLDAFLIEETGVLNTYFDGSTDPRAVWSGTAHASTSTLTTSLRYNPTINSDFSGGVTNWSVVASTAPGTLTQVTGLSGIVDTNLTTALQVVSSATTRTYNLISGNITSPAAFFAIGQTYTLSFYARVTSGSTTGFSAYLATTNGLDGVMPAYFAFTPTSSWQRFTTTFTATQQAASTTGWYVTLPTSAAVTAQFTGFLVEKTSVVYPYISGTGNLAVEISDLAPVYVVSPTYYSFVSASTWADLNTAVQDMDSKVNQGANTFNVGAFTSYLQIPNAYATYATFAAAFPTYASITTLSQTVTASYLTPYITDAQNEQTNAENSLASAQVSLSSIITENASRLDDFMIVGA